jgi:hypothetical protein
MAMSGYNPELFLHELKKPLKNLPLAAEIQTQNILNMECSALYGDVR